MKILFDYAAFTMQAKGGVSRCMFDLFRHLAESDEHSVILYAGIHRNRYLKQAPPELKKKIIGLYLPDGLFKQTLFMPFNRFCFQIYARLRCPDICHFTYYDAPKTPKCCKNVLTVYDMIHEKFPEYFGKDDPQTGWKKKSVKAADGVVCISENTQRDLAQYIDLTGKAVTAIPIGSMLHKIHAKPQSLLQPFLLYVGNRCLAYKNFNTVLNAFAEIRRFWPGNLLCFGGGAFDEKERALISDLGLASSIQQHSGDDDALVFVYQHAFALVYPSSYEGFGLPPVEAMSLGGPVISSDSPPMTEILSDACLYFTANNSLELVDKFKLLQSPRVREDFILKGKRHALKYSWDKIAIQTLKFYDLLLSSPFS